MHCLTVNINDALVLNDVFSLKFFFLFVLKAEQKRKQWEEEDSVREGKRSFCLSLHKNTHKAG